MHVEIKVAQNFVLNFLYNKLPRRRVNLFGEELESALRDKFADHWYPDKPFKGSAYRCLKITDPADPVLNRAARESGNPVPDIVENLPADLAIWIDPGEVSYRIGEKGSVKILYSENDSNNYAVQNGLLATVPSSARAEQVAPPPPPPPPPCQIPAAPVNVAPVHVNLSNSIQVADDLSPEICSSISPGLSLPLDNLNSSMNSLNISNNTSSNNMGNNTNNSNINGFAPFTPRPHQPVTYTAGTFAQTKFGSTKLKTNGKKPNRMSPTEFSNYIKQRAMQKQSSCPNNGIPINNMSAMPIGNGHFRNSGYRNTSGGNGGSGSATTNGSSGFYNHHQQQNLNLATGGINCGRMPTQQQQQQSSPDPFFYPLFPDRNPNLITSNGLSPSSSSSSSSSSCSMLFNGMGGNGSLSSSGSSSASSISSNPWSYTETDTDTFLQDILNVGLNASPKQSHRGIYSSASGDHFGFGSNGLGLGLSVGGGLGGFGSTSLGGLGGSGGLFDPMSPSDDGHMMMGNGGATKAVGGPTNEGQHQQQQQQQQQHHQRVLVAN